MPDLSMHKVTNQHDTKQLEQLLGEVKADRDKQMAGKVQVDIDSSDPLGDLVEAIAEARNAKWDSGSCLGQRLWWWLCMVWCGWVVN